jgi:hypothetical protein
MNAKEAMKQATDRELLEVAAKAAGIEVFFDEDGDCYRVKKSGNRHYWNPLTDDGDALRLAVRLRLNLSLDRTGLKVFHDDKPCIKAGGWESRADENEVVRRAIVRAAAEIGRSMK